MKNVYKFLILLISALVVSSGVFAQSDMSPKLKNQLEEKTKPQSNNQELQIIEAQDAAPTPAQMIQQRMEADGSINNILTEGEINSGPSDALCAPVYSSGCVVGDGFTDFALEEIQNLGNGCANLNGTGWSQYFGLGPATLVPGFTHTFTLGTGYSSQHANIWIDFNDDDVLTPDEMILSDYILVSAGVLYDVDITIPANATPGLHKMRVMAVWITTFTDPCGSYSYGEAEDYMVNVITPDYGDLEGYVTENTGGAAISGATVSVNGGMYTATTGTDGYYSIDEVLVGDWPIMCTKTGYNPNSGTVNIAIGATTQYDIAMTAPTMEIDPLTIAITIDPYAQATDDINITNNGDGPLEWSAQLEVLTEGTAELFDVLLDVPVGVGGGEAGIETDGTHIYTSRWNGTGQFERYTMDGTWIETITVAGSTGCRDIAYDGTYFYGAAAATTIFEMDLANATMISTFNGPAAARAIAYNENEDVFYCNNWSDNITKFNKSGQNLGSFPVGPVGASYYGLAYDNYSGGEYLWGYAQTGATMNELIQMELPSGVETGVTFDVGSVTNVGAGIAGGLAIDDNIVPGLWAILGTSQNENIWALELATAGPVWITIEPKNGTLNPGGSETMDVFLDANGLLPGFYYADITFSTNPNVGSPVVTVELQVEGLIPAINLSGVHNCTDVDLSWEMPTGGDADSWNVYRDGELIGNSDDMAHSDEMVDPSVEYSYTVTAVYGGEESFPTPPFVITVPVPGNLQPLNPEATHVGAGDILITWDAPNACLDPDEFDVYRDGTYIGTTSELEYLDEGLTVGFYEYYVVAVYYFGESGNSSPAYVLVGIGDVSATAFQIFPNPASDLVNVKSDFHVTSIEVLNNAGQVIYTENVESSNFNVNVSAYERGIYYFRLKTDDQVILRKIAVK